MPIQSPLNPPRTSAPTLQAGSSSRSRGDANILDLLLDPLGRQLADQARIVRDHELDDAGRVLAAEGEQPELLVVLGGPAVRFLRLGRAGASGWGGFGWFGVRASHDDRVAVSGLGKVEGLEVECGGGVVV